MAILLQYMKHAFPDLTNRHLPQKNISWLISYDMKTFDLHVIYQFHSNTLGSFPVKLWKNHQRSSNAKTTALLQTISSKWHPVLMKNLNKHGMTGKATQKIQDKDSMWSQSMIIYGPIRSTSSTSGTSRVNIATANTVWYQYNAPIPGIFNVLPIGVLPTHLLHPVARSIDLTL